MNNNHHQLKRQKPDSDKYLDLIRENTDKLIRFLKETTRNANEEEVVVSLEILGNFETYVKNAEKEILGIRNKITGLPLAK